MGIEPMSLLYESSVPPAKAEPTVGVEPTVSALRKHCFTTKLRWQLAGRSTTELHRLIYLDSKREKLYHSFL